MAASRVFCAGILVAAGLHGAPAVAQEPVSTASPASALSRNEGWVMLDYQVIRVPGDKPIDFMGFHILKQITDGVSVGAGVYAPLVNGEYGGFTAFDIGFHLRHRLTSRVFAAAGLSAGGGGGGRGIEQSKVLSGTGGFYKAYAGLGYEFSNFSIGVNVAQMKFKQSAIDGTQANVFVEMPYTFLTGPFANHGQAMSPADSRLAFDQSSENTLTLVLDNFRQIRPEGTYKGTLRVADLQYAHYFAPDTFWYFGLGVGYSGLPLYNHVLGGVGQRYRLSPRANLYAQVGIGSGGYAPELINTSAGLLVYPKLSAEYMVTKDLGLALSAGYLAAPKGSSKNQTYGVALIHHIRSGGGGAGVIEPEGLGRYQAFRVGVFHQTAFDIRYRDLVGSRLQGVGLQADAIIDDRWYLPLQATVGYSAYFGYPGYGEVLAGLGVQSQATAEDRLQFFGQLMGGANVHGPAVKISTGLRYPVGPQFALQLEAGKTLARKANGGQFSANSVSLGVMYRFSVAQR